MLNLEWYRSFKAIYERGTLTGAAEVLFLTQPGVSQQLNALESYMGVKLFERKPRRMLPTTHGIQLYNQIEESLNQLEKTEMNFKRSSILKRPVINIGMPIEMFSQTFVGLLNQFDFDIKFSFDSPDSLQEGLFKREMDLILTTLKTNYQHVEYQHYLREELLLVANKDVDAVPFHQFLYRQRLKDAEAWLGKQDWYSYSEKMLTIKSFWLSNFKKQAYFHPRYIIPNLASITEAVKKNHGLALLPGSLCQTALEKGELKELWQGNETVYQDTYFGIQTQSKNLNQVEEIIKIITKARA